MADSQDDIDIFDLAEPDEPTYAKANPCPSCGLMISANAESCLRCGQSLTTHTVAAAPSPTVRGGKTCRSCGYSLAGLTSNRCPECGTIDRPLSRRDIDAAESARMARQEYIKPLIMFGVGLFVASLLSFASLGFFGVGVFLAKYAIFVPIGVAIFWLCCLGWIGFDAPLHLTALRLAGIYAVVDATGLALGFIPIFFLGWLITVFVYVGLLSDMLELELRDAILVAVITFLARTALLLWAGHYLAII